MAVTRPCFERRRDELTGQLGQVGDLGAVRQGDQEAGGELEGVVERQHRQHPVVDAELKIFDSSDTMKVKLRCVSITPLGLPVVPEVKIDEASASGVGAPGELRRRVVLDRQLGEREGF